MVGHGDINSAPRRAMTLVPFQGSSTHRFVFSYLAQGSGISTGLAFLNPGSQPAAVLVEIFTAQGTLLDEISLTVGGSERVVGLLAAGFPKGGTKLHRIPFYNQSIPGC